ncbi:unnamed protein product [Adineta steineri]|uniref:Uncharacterized protein n=2 Tax=Adineta steineri TaxID=433720 RepID=A0A815SX86_9BILA|nr:unnamed protein product [Adineta steineri]
MPKTNQYFIYFIFATILLSFIAFVLTNAHFSTPLISKTLQVNYRRRPECTCLRRELPPVISLPTIEKNKSQSSLCSQYGTRRGPNQRIIAISLFGPKENKRFQLNRTLKFLYELIEDLDKIYSDDFILRIYHDNTINVTDIICPIECQHSNVDFCSTAYKKYIPPKIWRFLPAGDPLVDIMMSRDLDSAFTQRERAAVNAWIASNKSFHSMRDHPMHGVPMLGGLWGFRPSLNRTISRVIHNKIHNRELIRRYGGRADQTFLTSHVWPLAKASVIVHDSFLCKNGFGHKSEAFPTQRPSANETNCFVGCVRPCCGTGKMPFGKCPKECRPKDHPEWIYC